MSLDFYDKSANAVAIWGVRGCGKSTMAKSLIRDRRRIITFDPLDEYHAEGAKRVDNLGDLWRTVQKSWHDFNIAYVPPLRASEPAALDALASDLFAVQTPYHEARDRAEITLVVEEMSGSVPNVAHKAGHDLFLKLSLRGRHYGVNVIGISQRPAGVHNDFKNNTAENYFFQMHGDSQLNAARDKLGDFRHELPSLAVHECFHVAGGNVTRGKNVLT